MRCILRTRVWTAARHSCEMRLMKNVHLQAFDIERLKLGNKIAGYENINIVNKDTIL
jgi:hypothetical protein